MPVILKWSARMDEMIRLRTAGYSFQELADYFQASYAATYAAWRVYLRKARHPKNRDNPRFRLLQSLDL